jgi:hypothetical protein
MRTNNYKRMLDFIENDSFQVQILGHSCGLSDRTLLNTIFEHDNCKSIKVFYHEYQGENGLTDNLSDIEKNISRHFHNKPLMRSKLVNRELCKALPQMEAQ